MNRQDKIKALIKSMEAKKEHDWCAEEQLKLDGLYAILEPTERDTLSKDLIARYGGMIPERPTTERKRR